MPDEFEIAADFIVSSCFPFILGQCNEGQNNSTAVVTMNNTPSPLNALLSAVIKDIDKVSSNNYEPMPCLHLSL